MARDSRGGWGNPVGFWSALDRADIDLMSGHKVVSVFADVRHTKWGDSDDLFDIVMVFDNGVRARAAKADISFYSLP